MDSRLDQTALLNRILIELALEKFNQSKVEVVEPRSCLGVVGDDYAQAFEVKLAQPLNLDRIAHLAEAGVDCDGNKLCCELTIWHLRGG